MLLCSVMTVDRKKLHTSRSDRDTNDGLKIRVLLQLLGVNEDM